MSILQFVSTRLRNPFVVFCLLAFLAGAAGRAFAHGGEDHGDEKPKTTANAKGLISHTARLGAYELMLKHPALEPNAATGARLFITEFATNNPATNIEAAVEIQSSDGAALSVALEKTEDAGTYNLKIPALSAGTYTIRAKLTYAGETDTAAFSGVDVKSAPADTAAGGASFGRDALIYVVGAIVLGLFGVLFYFVWRMPDARGTEKETVSA